MEKAFSLSPEEQQFLQQLNAESTQALAQYGAATIEIKAAEKRIEGGQERERAFVRSALLQRGVTQFETARVNGTNLECRLPDPPPAPPAPAGEHKTNGAPPLPLEALEQ